MVKIPSLAGSAEAAAILGVNRQRLHVLQQTPGFPDPVQRLACGPIWIAEDLNEFAKATNRHAGQFCQCRMHGPGAERAMCPIHP